MGVTAKFLDLSEVSLQLFTFSINSSSASIPPMLLKLFSSRSLLVSMVQNPKITSPHSQSLCSVCAADCFAFLMLCLILASGTLRFCTSFLHHLLLFPGCLCWLLAKRQTAPHRWVLGTCFSLFAPSHNESHLVLWLK